MKPSEIIDKALTEVMPNAGHWMQGKLTDGCSNYCMVGSMQAAAGILGVSTWVDDRYQNYRDAYKAITDVLVDQLSAESITRFNDSPHRTYGEVRKVMEKARAGLQEQGR